MSDLPIIETSEINKQIRDTRLKRLAQHKKDIINENIDKELKRKEFFAFNPLGRIIVKSKKVLGTAQKSYSKAKVKYKKYVRYSQLGQKPKDEFMFEKPPKNQDFNSFF